MLKTFILLLVCYLTNWNIPVCLLSVAVILRDAFKDLKKAMKYAKK